MLKNIQMKKFIFMMIGELQLPYSKTIGIRIILGRTTVKQALTINLHQAGMPDVQSVQRTFLSVEKITIIFRDISSL